MLTLGSFCASAGYMVSRPCNLAASDPNRQHREVELALGDSILVHAGLRLQISMPQV